MANPLESEAEKDDEKKKGIVGFHMSSLKFKLKN